MKNIVILGSTGSIGRSALDVISVRRDRFRVVGLTARRNHELLLRQIEEFGPEVVAVSDPGAAAFIREKVSGKSGPKVLEGERGLAEAASWESAGFVLSAIVGFAGLLPTLAAVKAGKDIGLANKETLVVAGDIVKSEAARSGTRIIPVDSEHSAVFQCLGGADRAFLSRIVLTASGGPFAGKSARELDGMTPEDALKHPSWSMGRKITIDSATLMNKGLEVIEAHHLFGVGPESIDVLIHPQSIVHSMVEFTDGAALAQLSVPDMRGAIAYALSFPERMEAVIPRLDLSSVGELSFSKPDHENFPCLSYAYKALEAGGAMPAVLNAANEAAVEFFLDGKIGFNDIPAIIKKTMDSQEAEKADRVETVLDAHRRAYEYARGLIGSVKVK
jgi:1-deoxy-D-xylulose-5-phosphate reductoisomerase